MARWTIPTLIQLLVDEGTDVEVAAMLVQDTWPRTGGDDHYRSPNPALGDEHSYGAYAAILSPGAHSLAANDGRVRLQAVYAASIIRMVPDDLPRYFDFARQTDLVATAAAQRTVTAIRSGLTIEPEEMPETDGLTDYTAQVRQDAARGALAAQGIVDSLGRLG